MPHRLLRAVLHPALRDLCHTCYRQTLTCVTVGFAVCLTAQNLSQPRPNEVRSLMSVCNRRETEGDTALAGAGLCAACSPGPRQASHSLGYFPHWTG